MSSGDGISNGTADKVQHTIADSDNEDELSKPNRASRQTQNLAGTDDENMVDGSDGKYTIEVHVPTPARPWDYVKFAEDMTINHVVEELQLPGNELRYRVAFEDGREAEFKVSFDKLLNLRKGPAALDHYNAEEITNSASPEPDRRRRPASTGESAMSSETGKRKRLMRQRNLLIDKRKTILVSDEEDEDLAISDTKRQRVSRPRISLRLGNASQKYSLVNDKRIRYVSDDEEFLDDLDMPSRNRERPSKSSLQSTHTFHSKNGRIDHFSGVRRSQRISYDSTTSEDDEIDELASDDSESTDDNLHKRQRSRSKPKRISRGVYGHGRGRPSRGGLKRGAIMFHHNRHEAISSEDPPAPTRRSERATKATKNMKERMEDEEMFADVVNKDKSSHAISIREIFKPLPPKSKFRDVHNKQCDICGTADINSHKGPSPLVFCQGCSTSIHKVCLGNRSNREHIVTKVAEEDFIMQCRRCVGVAIKKDFTAPRLDICQACKNPGDACEAFSQKKTSKQEEKLREENEGQDPITSVDPDVINNSAIVLFRCIHCRRGFHFEHLPPRNPQSTAKETAEDIRDIRITEYSSDYTCKECLNAPAKVQSLVAWRPTEIDKYVPGQTYDLVGEADKDYLVKWEEHSYFRCTWMQGAWVWGVTTTMMRKAFSRRDEGVNALPKMKAEDAIPEDFLRIETVLDVKYSSHVKTHTEEIDKARINEVEQIFAKFQGLGYEDVAWESPPNPTESERWADFVAAYNEYIAGKYFKQPQAKMKERMELYRATDFEHGILQNVQPACLMGGQLMEYQLEGLNWLLYNFHREKNVVLADEMGLGKTIQVIGAIATLVKEKPKCWPFLVVVPNSTCPNWQREIKKWAPSLRVIAYYGVRKARDIAMEYELYPDGCSDMRAHVVVTSYEAPVDNHSRLFFQKVKWVGMVVDEGQRLKNDKNLLYGSLAALKVPFRVLLTGTPLQNNKRELFNLLQFLDNKMNAEKLDEKYAELTNENLSELHDLIRPYFLRRTKVQVLKFLPPMAQVIIPVSMSVVQKKLYRSILAKNPDLIRSIFVKDQSKLRSTERGSLNNLLIQLRKVLCHPFIYSEAVEERSAIPTVSHRNLVDASSKLQLLEIMLPKLRERGHRVLIFSQFLKQLDIVEDFLDGLGLSFKRLDGSVGSLEKQKRIDAYNAPNSEIFAFLLSTRAGGVGINLATADTVIIMDPDFNPHQDIQALSRAHRIGQKKKVLVFQLMTKESAEEKIVQIGRKKMALDHVLIESMDADDDAGLDLQSILQHGAQALFDDDTRHDITYDSASVSELLDRSQVENTNIGDDNSAESQFSFARIWVNDKNMLADDVGHADSNTSRSTPTVWDKILKQRERDATAEAVAQQKLFGRGRRKRQTVDYSTVVLDEAIGSSPQISKVAQPIDISSDTDFAAAPDSGVDEESDVPKDKEASADASGTTDVRQATPFHRVKIIKQIPPIVSVKGDPIPSVENDTIPTKHCHACGETHVVGYCPLKLAGVEHCGLCGIAHFGGSDICPHLMSEGQVRLMLDALKVSTEPKEIIEMARTQLRSRIHELVEKKKQRRASLELVTDTSQIQHHERGGTSSHAK